MKRMKLLAVLTFTFLFILSCEVFATDKIAKNKMTSEGKKRSYYLFVPTTVNKDKPVPLLVLLHGSGRGGRILVEHWRKLAAQESIILAGPNALDSSN
jgi:poly(3-hydroxybutyrate) depolymerase